MDTHWRNTQKSARFFSLDARVFAAILLFLVHAKLWTFALAILCMLIFWVMERKGLSFDSSLRALRAWLLGRHRPALLKERKRRWIDFG